MKRYRLQVTLTLRAPVISQAVGARAFGVDTASVRAQSNHPALPGELIRGNLREAWEYFVDLLGASHGTAGVPKRTEMDEWLGKESPSGTNKPARARLSFLDQWVCTQEGGQGVRYRIAVDAKTGAVTPGALQVIESPHSSGQELEYTGNIELWADDDTQADRIALWIRKGLQFTPALGALKGVGFGKVLAVKVERENLPVASAEAGSGSMDGFAIRLCFDRPFCFARPHAMNNRFEAEEFVPGGAIKGAIARRLSLKSGKLDNGAFPNLCQYFEAVRITHAMAVAKDSNKRPVAIPWSLVAAPVAAGSKEEKLYDIATKEDPAGLIHGRAPAFQIDWKGSAWGRAAELCGVCNPERGLKVRTAIDRATGAASRGQLFATETIVPGELRWLADVDLGLIKDASARALVAKELLALLAGGLEMLGKTKARAAVEVLPQRSQYVIESKGLLVDNLAIVTLQTAARLLPNYRGPATNGGKELFDAYQASWAELSDKSLELVRFFARQELVGGGYLWKRFRPGEPYNPESLTTAGSVLVLRATDKTRAQEKLKEWVAHGLPQLQGAPGGGNWQQTPYIRQNGYGEIAVNLSIHWDKSPDGGWQKIKGVEHG